MSEISFASFLKERQKPINSPEEFDEVTISNWDILVTFFDEITSSEKTLSIYDYIWWNDNTKRLLDYYKKTWFYSVCIKYTWDDYPEYYKKFCDRYSMVINSWAEKKIILETNPLEPQKEIILIPLRIPLQPATQELVFDFSSLLANILSPNK